MSDPEIPRKSPYYVNLEPGQYRWCSCGRSKNQPWCDDSHVGTDFLPVVFSIDEPLKLELCGCKHTQDRPFCDGSHCDL